MNQLKKVTKIIYVGKDRDIINYGEEFELAKDMIPENIQAIRTNTLNQLPHTLNQLPLLSKRDDIKWIDIKNLEIKDNYIKRIRSEKISYLFENR